ncbi:MAG: porin [Armatimonadota bacterium]
MRKLAIPLVVLSLLTLAAMACAQDNWTDDLAINGYFQARYEGDDATEDEFKIRRMFTNLIADLSDDANAVLTFAYFDNYKPGFEDDIIIYNMFVDYQINDVWSARFGLVPTTFGYEAWQSSQSRIALERARILQGDPGAGSCGFYFGGASDRGLLLKRAGENGAPDLYFSVANGQFRRSDANSAKNIGIDAKWQRDWGQFGVSWLDGTYTDAAGLETDRDAMGAYALFDSGAFNFQAEYADGELRGADRDGWYLQVSKPMADKPWMPYVKYEEYNADTNAGCIADWSALRGGVVWDLDEANQLTVEIYDTDDDHNDVEVGGFGVSWQASY